MATVGVSVDDKSSRVEPVKVTRYFPGRKPLEEEEQRRQERNRDSASAASVDRQGDGDRSQRRIAVAQIVAQASQKRDRDDSRRGDGESEGSEDEDEAELRRQRARQRRLERMKEEEEAAAQEEGAQDDDDEVPVRRKHVDDDNARRRPASSAVIVRKQEFSEEESNDDSDEYETDSDEEESEEEEEEEQPQRLVFKSKEQRKTVDMSEALRLSEERAQLEKEQRLAERAAESKEIAAEEIRKAEERMKNGGGYDSDEENELPDDRDDVNEEEEYEAWRLRELMRIKRDRETLKQAKLEAEEVERRRQMTDEEIRRDDAMKGTGPKQKGEKEKWNFLQRYYHKGAFYHDSSADLLERDYSAPTGDDKVDKSKLPSVLQVKNFGKAGRTKYTHLADQDTTRKDDNPWGRSRTTHAGERPVDEFVRRPSSSSSSVSGPAQSSSYSRR